MKYNLSKIMKRAWEIFRKAEVTFSEALHRAWSVAKAEPVNAERIKNAITENGITEEVKTYSEWKKAGREVIHGMKRLFMVELIHASKGDDKTYKASFFSLSQTQPLEA